MDTGEGERGTEMRLLCQFNLGLRVVINKLVVLLETVSFEFTK